VSRAIEPFLEALAVEARATAPWRWELSVRRKRAGRMSGQARREGDWLVLDLEAPSRAAGAEPEDLLRRNAGLDGVGRLVVLAGERRPRLRAELPVEELADRLAAGLETSRQAFDRAVDALAGVEEPAGAGRPEGADDADAAKALAAAAEESVWPVRWGADGAGAVDVGRRDAPRRAELRAHGRGFRAALELADPAGYGTAGRRALALLLLAASASVRLVRAVAREGEEGRRLGFEVGESAPATEVAVDRALCTLSLAAQLAAREAEDLAAEPLADRYLASLGWTP